MALTGCNFVRFSRHGLQAIRKTWKKCGDQFEIRRQALKLRFWDERQQHPPGRLFDHTYESIKAVSDLGIYELRLDDEIGGQSNIRVVFFDPPKDWKPLIEVPLRIVWILEVLPKRRDGWTTNQIDRFRISRNMHKLRFYT